MTKYIIGVFLFIGFVNSAAANTYQCTVDKRGVMVCYPKPRGF
jgi:hypothetical protein